MNLAIGIDTGGTCTDAVIYEYGEGKVLCKGKDLTTKEDLSVGISKAMAKLPVELLNQAKVLTLSTTLATNACVENKGGLAKLILIGTSDKLLDRIDIEKNYGVKRADTICIEHHTSYDGTVVEPIDFDTIFKGYHDQLVHAQALSVVAANATKNGAVVEKAAFEALKKVYDVPIVLGSSLVNDLNMIERGATAQLNAKLLPIIHEFMIAVDQVKKANGLDIPTMIVRSDGSLMSQEVSRKKPVETILCGPAASVLGGKNLTQVKDALIIDIGGTTTDISIVKNDIPATVDKGIRIGGWRTQVKGVFIDTFALGGDSAIKMENGRLTLSNRRVLPLCVAATRWPAMLKDLESLMLYKAYYSEPLHEFVYLVKKPKKTDHYNKAERTLLKVLEKGPLMIGNAHANGINEACLKTERLEKEGYVMYAGLTPTDFMHIKGDYENYNKEASILGARYVLRCLARYKDNDLGLRALAEEAYDVVKKKLYTNVVRVFFENRYPEIYGQSVDQQTIAMIEASWEGKKSEKSQMFFDVKFDTKASLVGIGAPTYVFLPDVAKALGTKCLIPEHAEVANAVGATVANISVKIQIDISPMFNDSSLVGYTVHGINGIHNVQSIEAASEIAMELALNSAKSEAKKRGSVGALSCETVLEKKVLHSKEGDELENGATAIAIVTGNIKGA